MASGFCGWPLKSDPPVTKERIALTNTTCRTLLAQKKRWKNNNIRLALCALTGDRQVLVVSFPAAPGDYEMASSSEDEGTPKGDGQALQEDEDHSLRQRNKPRRAVIESSDDEGEPKQRDSPVTSGKDQVDRCTP